MPINHILWNGQTSTLDSVFCCLTFLSLNSTTASKTWNKQRMFIFLFNISLHQICITLDRPRRRNGLILQKFTPHFQMCVKFGDCCPDYQDVCGNAFDDKCQRKGKVSGPADDDNDDNEESNSSNNLGKFILLYDFRPRLKCHNNPTFTYHFKRNSTD